MLNCTLNNYDLNLKINNIFSLMERHKSAKNMRAPKFAYESRFIFINLKDKSRTM